jgi:hypothetical protein
MRRARVERVAHDLFVMTESRAEKHLAGVMVRTADGLIRSGVPPLRAGMEAQGLADEARAGLLTLMIREVA